jgi:endonuclease/exonuclease/phosphatase family metal-dependent hydrolase
MAALVLDYMPDVIGLQESTSRWHKAFKPLLIDTGLYGITNRQSHADGFKYCACPILYNPLTVQVVEEYLIDLDKHSDCRVFAVTVFEKLSDGTRFVVANTHPASSTDTEVYARNCADIMEIGAAEMAKYADLPFIMTGDYNTRESSEMYQTLMNTLGVKDAKYEADVMVRDQGTYFEWGTEPAPQADDCIDHIFVNGKTDVKLYNVVIDHDVQNTSDHFPIYADIDLQ